MCRRLRRAFAAGFFSFSTEEVRPLCLEDFQEELVDPPEELARLIQPHGGLFNERGTIDTEELP